MKTSLRVLFLSLATAGTTAQAQFILNGSFEQNGATADVINMVNATWDTLVQNSAAFGDWNGGGPNGGDLDLINSNAYCGLAQHGSWFCALTSGGTDAFSLELSSPLAAGATYSVTFYDRTCAGFGGQGVELGVSNSPSSFGTLVYSGPNPVADVGWTQRLAVFTAPVAGYYLTVRCGGINSGGPWTQVDNFSFNNGESVPENALAAGLSFVVDDASRTLTILGLNADNHDRVLVMDALGRAVLEDGARSTFDLNRMAAGTYTLLLVREQRVLYHRFVLR